MQLSSLCMPTKGATHTPPVAAPCTPPILSQLVQAHQAFVAKKEREAHIQWLLQVAAEIDARQQRRRDRLQWVLDTSASIDLEAALQFAAEPKDLN